jgi:hypothetical protein
VLRVDDAQVGLPEGAPNAGGSRQERLRLDEEIAVIQIGEIERRRPRVEDDGDEAGGERRRRESGQQPREPGRISSPGRFSRRGYGTTGSAQQRKPVE